MNKQRTVDSKVLSILRECPETRYDDMQLILCYYNRYSYMRVGDLPLEDIVNNYKGYGLPCFETIRRARQRVQSLFPELSRQCSGCDCGNITMVTTGNLVNRHSKSCGCLKTKAQQAMRQPSNERTPSGLHIKIPAAGQRTIKQAEKLPRRQAVEALAKVCRVVRHIA